MGGRCKGTLLVNMRSLVSETGGERPWEELVAEATPEDRVVLRGPLLVSSWYPVGTYNRILDRHLARAPSREEEMLRFARHVANRDLNSVMRFILSLASPEGIVSRSPMFWQRYFDAGAVQSRALSPRHWSVTVEAPTDPDEGAGEATCRWGVAGWLGKGVLLAGANGVRTAHPRCRFAGAPSCETTLEWA